MARYSRRTGPAADFILPVAGGPIPNLIVQRAFDAGELLIMATLRLKNDAAAVRQPTIRLLIDGIDQPNPEWSDTIEAAGRTTAHIFTIHPIEAGLHTIQLQSFGQTDATQVAFQNLSTLLVIQLPLWDADVDIT